MTKKTKKNDAIMTGILVTRFKMGQINVEDLGADGSRYDQSREVLGGEEGAGRDRGFCLIWPQVNVVESAIGQLCGSIDYGRQIFPVTIPEDPHACCSASW